MPFCLGDIGNRVLAVVVAASFRWRYYHAVNRSQFRHWLFQTGPRWGACSFSTPILVLRAPGSLHYDTAGFWNYQSYRVDFLQEASIRIPWNGIRDGSDRWDRFRRLG